MSDVQRAPLQSGDERMQAGLLVVDVQNDFCPGGALAIPAGHEVVPILNRYMRRFQAARLPVYLSRDWHPARSRHFAQFGGRWPAHCVQGTPGAEFHRGLTISPEACVISKGTSPEDEGYSAFEGRDAEGTPLIPLLVRHGVDTLCVGGLATEYCVRASVMDALAHGFHAVLLTDAIRALDSTAGARAIDEMQQAGATLGTLEDVSRDIGSPPSVGQGTSS